MFSVISQEKTPLRDHRGGSVYRRAYLCDTAADVDTLPVDDAPGSLAYVAADSTCHVLDHTGTWRVSREEGIPWRV